MVDVLEDPTNQAIPPFRDGHLEPGISAVGSLNNTRLARGRASILQAHAASNAIQGLLIDYS